MANELVNIELPKIIVNRVCAEATLIPLNTLMKLSGTNTVIASSADNDVYGGISIEEFSGGEGLTHIGCALDGVWDVLTGAAVTLGAICNVGGANTVVFADAAALLTGSTCCKAEEAAGGAAVTRMRFGVMN
ncbi:MAG: hypothetical protein KAK00_11060 [Nanoarchaeota archaeon]|nr:hypothetical protein [Nanoarchaeota archaeon]